MQFDNNNFGAGPFNPAPNIGSIGYNNSGGYYSNNYNTYNPYQQYQMQQELLRQQEMERQRIIQEQNSIVNIMTKSVYTYEGVSEEDLPKQDKKSLDYQYEIYRDTQDYMRMAYIQDKVDPKYKSEPYLRLKNHLAQVSEYHEQFITQDMDLFDFMNNAYKVLYDNERLRQEKRERDLRQMYNSQSYHKLLGMHSKFNKVFTSDGVMDDMEITLPNHLKSEFQERKALFLSRITNKL